MPNWGGGGKGAASGAAKGAAIGSIVPGVGTLIGGGIGAGVGFFKGLFSDDGKSGADKDSLDGDLDVLRGSAAFNRRAGQQSTQQGTEGLGDVLKYFQNIMGNDPSATLAATAPERGRVIDQFDSARRSAATFGPRGGQSNAAVANSYTQQAQTMADIGAIAKRNAATGAGQVGGQLAALGVTQQQLASHDIDSVIRAVLGQEGIDVSKRGQNMELWGGVGETAGGILGEILLKKYGGLGGKSTPMAGDGSMRGGIGGDL